MKFLRTTGTVAALQLLAQTDFAARNWGTYDSLGFGISFHYCNAGLVNNMLAMHSAGRSIATERVSYTLFKNSIAGAATNQFVGIALRWGSHRNVFTNAIAVSNQEEGFMFWQSSNNYFASFIARFNFVGNTGCNPPNGYCDITFQNYNTATSGPPSINNFLRIGEWGSTWNQPADTPNTVTQY